VLLDHRAISLRSPRVRAAFRVQHEVAMSFAEFLTSQGFTKIHTPKLVLAGAEGGSDIFKVEYFDERAYLFVLTALEYCQQRLPERRHINGRELAISCRELALEHYGVLARMVLEHWGVRTTADIGDVVFTLVDLELLMSQPTDTRKEFIGVYDIEESFEREYPWCGVQPV